MHIRVVYPWMSGAIALVAVTTVGCANSSNPLSPQPVFDTQPAIQAHPEIGADVAAVKAATARFHDVEVAIAAGYADPANGTCQENPPSGAMGVHSGKPALLGNQAIDPLQPEVLLFLPKPGGGFRLVAVEYVQWVLVRNKTTGVITPWTASDQWSSAYEIAAPRPSLFGVAFEGPIAPHFVGMPWHWEMHAWIWANNPSGMFAPWNPAISCR
jgi:hypothetical protein